MNVTFANNISIVEAEQIFEKIEKVIKNWFDIEKLTNEQKARLYKLIYDFHCFPKTDLHDQWKDFRKIPSLEKEKRKDDYKTETIKSWKEESIEGVEHTECVILRIEEWNLLSWNDTIMTLAKEFGEYDEKERKIKYKYDPIYKCISKKRYPGTFDRCVKNLVCR